MYFNAVRRKRVADLVKCTAFRQMGMPGAGQIIDLHEEVFRRRIRAHRFKSGRCLTRGICSIHRASGCRFPDVKQAIVIGILDRRAENHRGPGQAID